MGATVQKLKELSGDEQVAYFHARQRRLSLEDPSRGLFRTHDFPIPTAAVASASFPTAVLSRQTTFRTKIRITAATLGTVFEFGNSTAGFAIALDSQNIFVVAGNGVAADPGAAILQFDNGAAWPVGLELEIVAAVRPANGVLELWLNGKSVLRVQAAGLALTNGRWADSDTGAFAAAPNGTINLNIPLAARVAPSGFDVINRLSAFIGSTPRGFFLTP